MVKYKMIGMNTDYEEYTLISNSARSNGFTNISAFCKMLIIQELRKWFILTIENNIDEYMLHITYISIVIFK